MIKSFLRTFLGFIALVLVLSAGAQVVPVAASSALGFPAVAVWAAIAVAVAVAAYLWLKKHRPAVAATVSNDATLALRDAIALIDRLTHHTTTPATPAAPPAAAAPVAATPQPAAPPSPPAAVPAPPAPTPAVAPKPEQTWAQWIVANHPEALPRLGALLAAANGLPGSLTYAEMWDVISAAPAPAPQQAGDSWSQWTGPIPVGSLDRNDLSFAQMIETTIVPGTANQTYGSLFWLSRIGGTADQVKAWRELGADQAFNSAAYVAADPHGLVAAARTAGVPV